MEQQLLEKTEKKVYTISIKLNLAWCICHVKQIGKFVFVQYLNDLVWFLGAKGEPGIDGKPGQPGRMVMLIFAFSF